MISTRPRRYLRGLSVVIFSLMLAGSLLMLPMCADARAARPFSAEFSLRASNGYLVSVVGEHHEVAISVSKKGRQSSRLMETTYIVPAAVSRDGIEANLKDFGE